MSEKSKCDCGPDCKCGCQEGKPCTCHGECHCGDNKKCDCGPDCKCGCQEGKPCTCTVVIIKNVTVDRIVNVVAKRASLALAMVNATVVVNKTYGVGYAASIS